MIEKIKDFFGRLFRSLRAGMLIAIILGTALGVITYFIVRDSVNNWVENEYNSRESREERYENYISDLQTFIVTNAVSSNDTKQITRWARGNRNVYVFLYKDNQLFYDDLQGDADKDDSFADNPPAGDEGDAEEDKGNEGSGSQEGTIGGITVDYPTREEIIALAEKNGQRPIDFTDGTLFVSLVDFTEYIYYDVANIASLVSAFVVLVIVLMLYFTRLTSNISRLAQDVSLVYEKDMNTEIRVQKGDNEFSKLTRNVEEMRTTMLSSLEKEKEALTANSELITSMSHDIRTPLTVLLGYLDIMKSYSDDSVMQEYLKASEGTALKLKELSDDLFNYFLVFGDNNVKAEFSHYGAKTLFDQLLSEHVLLLGERSYKVSVHMGKMITDNIKVSTDAPKLARIIDNLFSNIYKYADEKKPVAVAIGVRGQRVSLVIKNFVGDRKDQAESNKIGLKTCKKLSELLDIRFEYGTVGIIGSRSFYAKLELPIAEKESEG